MRFVREEPGLWSGLYVAGGKQLSALRMGSCHLAKEGNKCPTKTHLSLILERQGSTRTPSEQYGGDFDCYKLYTINSRCAERQQYETSLWSTLESASFLIWGIYFSSHQCFLWVCCLKGGEPHTQKYGQSLAGEWKERKSFLRGFVTQISRCKSLGFKVQANARGKGWEFFPSSCSEISIPSEEFLRSTAHDSGDNDLTSITFCLLP